MEVTTSRRLFLEEQLLRLLTDPATTDIFDNIFPEPSQSENILRLLAAVIYATLAILGCIINFFFCLMIWRTTFLHRVSHILMTNLAVSNLLFLIFHSPYFLLTYILEADWVLGEIICKASFSVAYVTVTGSFYFMALVALDRWIAIFSSKRRLNFKFSMILTLGAWLLSVLAASPYMYQSGVIIVNLNVNPAFGTIARCGRLPTKYDTIMYLVILIIQYGIPLAIMIPTYAHLSYFLYKKQPIGVQTKESSRRYLKKKRRMVGTLVGCLIVQLICWTPLFAMPFLNKTFLRYHCAVRIVTSMIALVGVLLTPICYLTNEGLSDQVCKTLVTARMRILCCFRKNSSSKNSSNQAHEAIPLRAATTMSPSQSFYSPITDVVTNLTSEI